MVRSLPVISIVVLLSCVVTIVQPDAPITISRVDGQGDTVTVFPILRIAISQPVVDSTVYLWLTPPGHSRYAIQLSPTKDTVTLHFTEPLQGKTRYVVRISDSLRSVGGGYLMQGNDSVVFFTHPAEQEPNNAPQTADTLWTAMCGIVSPANDTDCYLLPTTSATLVLMTFGARCGYWFCDFFGSNLLGGTTAKATDTLHTPRNATWLYVVSATPSDHDRYFIKQLR